MTTLFKQAHALTRATIQPNDNYQATFILCLRAIIADSKARLAEHSGNTVFEAINYQAPSKAIDFELLAPIAAFIMLFVVFFALLFGFHTVSANTDAKRTHDRTIQTIDKVASYAPSSTDVMLDNIQSAIDASGVQGVTVVYE